jgi:UDP-N-acetylmuramyl pentapeptide phosphotransferase/UDP-N-acetylglucosamine-1-phosphate transferase
MTKSHRVGTLTLGGMLITFGILFLLRLFIAGITFSIIFKLWPLIFVFLGIEILLANFTQKDNKLVYDKTAIALIVILSFFAMGMAITEFCMEYANFHLTLN